MNEDDDDDTAAELLDAVDVRSVSVVWGPLDDLPQVAFSGTSVYEAIGFLVCAFFHLLGAAQDDEGDDDE